MDAEQVTSGTGKEQYKRNILITRLLADNSYRLRQE